MSNPRSLLSRWLRIKSKYIMEISYRHASLTHGLDMFVFSFSQLRGPGQTPWP